MSTARKLTLAGLIVALLLLGMGAYAVNELYIPLKLLRNEAWWDSATVAERREVCHKLIRPPLLVEHDAVTRLAEVGDDTSVGVLIRALPRNEGPHVCTYSHCLDVLRKLTGHDAGNRFADWRRWWEEEGRDRFAEDQ